MAFDASVAYDAAHRTWLISSLAGRASGLSFGDAVLVNRSPDGLHWSDPVTVARKAAGGLDKDWIVCDNHRHSRFFGHCYAEFDDVVDGGQLLIDQLLMSTSTDGGRTWNPPVRVEGARTGFGGQPVVQRNGTVVVPYVAGFLHLPQQERSIKAFRSTDGGQTWSAPVTVSRFSRHLPSGLQLPVSPSAGVDRDGKVYVVWQDCRFRAGCQATDVVLTSSRDGRSWTSPKRIPTDPLNSGADHFQPGLAVDPHTTGDHARLALTYDRYPDAACAPATCELNVGFISSSDGGATWSAPRQLAGPMRLDWFPNTIIGRYIGDYISTSFVHERAVPFFPQAGPPTGTSFDEAIATVPGGLPVSGRSGP